jgi:hypothetical protein
MRRFAMGFNSSRPIPFVGADKIGLANELMAVAAVSRACRSVTRGYRPLAGRETQKRPGSG